MQQGYAVASSGIDTLDDEIYLTQQAFADILDLEMTIRHVQWNMQDAFKTLHMKTIFDSYCSELRAVSNSLAQLIVSFGGEVPATPEAVLAARRFNEYQLDRATPEAHVAALEAYVHHVVFAMQRTIETVAFDNDDAERVFERALMLTSSLELWLQTVERDGVSAIRV